MKCNEIDENAAKALAHSLRGKHGLEVLDLSINKISDTGAVEISQALKSNMLLYCVCLIYTIIISDHQQQKKSPQ